MNIDKNITENIKKVTDLINRSEFPILYYSAIKEIKEDLETTLLIEEMVISLIKKGVFKMIIR